MKLYLTGPMSGLPLFNKPAFFRAAAELRVLGHEVINPAETDQMVTKNPKWTRFQNWCAFLEKDIPFVLACEGMALLPDWHKSPGACLEVFIAWVFGKGIYWAKTVEPVDRGMVMIALTTWVTRRILCYDYPN